MTLLLENLSKSFGSQKALDRVTLHVRRGDCYGFLGHNGAGKTTALRIALGLIRPSSGTVRVDGFDARRHPREARARQGGLIEAPAFYGWMTGLRNLVHLARLSGRSGREARREAGCLLESVGLSSAGDRRVCGYSQGMRQRLGIALALIGSPDVLLLDEPTNGLDPEGIEEFRSLVVRLVREEDRTVLLSSHQLHEVAGICNRVGILKEGRLLVEAETRDLLGRQAARLLLRTNDPALASDLLRGMGVEVGEGAEGALEIEPGDVDPSRISRTLVESGLELRELSSRPASLEDIYLRYSREDAPAGEVPEAGRLSPPGAPRERRAPGRAVPRTFAAEVRRIMSRRITLLALILPAVLGLFQVLTLARSSRAHLEAVAEGRLISTTSVTAFEAVGVGLAGALPLAALVLAALASQSLAGELSRGTLRNLLLRPIGRVRLAAGKLLGCLGIGLACYALLAATCLVAGAAAFDFVDVEEVLETRFALTTVIVDADELRPVLRALLPALALPLAAYAALGFLAGAVTRRGSTALALGAGAVLFLDLLRAVGREYGFEKYLLSAYLPSPLGDTSYVSRLLGLIRAPNDTLQGFVDTAITVPLAWILIPAVLAPLILLRRSVP